MGIMDQFGGTADDFKKQAGIPDRADLEELQNELPDRVAEARMEMEKGTDPHDPKAKSIAGRIMQIVGKFTGGQMANAGDGLKSLVSKFGPLLQGRLNLDPRLADYITKAAS